MDEVISILENKKQWYNTLIGHYEKALKRLPMGSLVMKKVSGREYLYYQFRDSGGKRNQRYLSDADARKFVPELRKRRFMEESLKLLYTNLTAAEHFLQQYKEIDTNAIMENIGKAYHQYGELEWLTSLYADGLGSRDIVAWCSETYDKNPFYPENLIHITMSGRRVRSKSEAIIANLLDAEGIPYRYEAVLELGKQQYYPDFTILRPRDKKLIYWEHFGMIGNEAYEKYMDEKLAVYRANGIVPWDNLFITYDKGDGSINTQDILWMIRSWKDKPAYGKNDQYML